MTEASAGDIRLLAATNTLTHGATDPRRMLDEAVVNCRTCSTLELVFLYPEQSQVAEGLFSLDVTQGFVFQVRKFVDMFGASFGK